MAFYDNFSVPDIGSGGWFKVALLIAVGIIVGLVVKFFIKKIAKITIYPWIRKSNPGSYKRTVSGTNLVAEILQWVIIILFVFQALSIFKIFLLEELLKLSISFVPKLALGFLIIILGLVISNIISRKIRDMEFDRNELVAKIFSMMFIAAVVLSALEVIGVMLTPFLYVFIAGLFAVALALAIMIGIAFGLALKPEITRIIKDIKKKVRTK
ncbi:MAG TPA: hypothetical protein VMZ91_05460 [Candidatus Paceibacterota bacterium]|nr:hypothetical protein [Candidatus Paceibacterota bacterium]